MKTLIAASILLSLFGTSQAIAQQIPEHERTVRITLPDGSFGHGVLLDRQRVLTAAHVVGNGQVKVPYQIDTFSELALSANLIKVGNPSSNDLAILKLDRDYPREISPLLVCPKAPIPGDVLRVRFLSKERSAYLSNGISTHASHDLKSMYKGETFSEMTEAFFSRGVSGSPVFLQEKDCLAGIISRNEFSSDFTNCVEADLSRSMPPNQLCSAKFGTRFVTSLDIRPFIDSSN